MTNRDKYELIQGIWNIGHLSDPYLQEISLEHHHQRRDGMFGNFDPNKFNSQIGANFDPNTAGMGGTSGGSSGMFNMMGGGSSGGTGECTHNLPISTDVNTLLQLIISMHHVMYQNMSRLTLSNIVQLSDRFAFSKNQLLLYLVNKTRI